MLDKYLPLYIAVFLTTLLMTVLIERRLIPYLKGRADQPIYEDGPAWHLSKGATPTMGGLAFLSSATFSLAFCAIFFYSVGDEHSASSLLTYTFFCIGNALIGLFDDLTKLKRNKNAGLTPKQKLIFQSLIAAVFLAFNSKHALTKPSLDFIIGKTDSFALYFPAAMFIILGIVNCANLTDGIDGLASSVAYGVGISFFLMSASSNPICAILSTAIMGSSVAFLFFNINPAKIFMGDTGSLFFGALALSCAFSIGTPLSIIPIGIIYVIEGVSVILQVLVFKLTKKRLFKMAPIHHHLEKCGMSENKICLIAIIITLISSLIPLMIKL